MNVEEKLEYIDTCILTSDDIKEYDIDEITLRIKELIKDFKKARNKFLDGYHYRMTPKYEPRLEMFTQKKSDPVGTISCLKLDNQDEYNEFNTRLEKLLALMSNEESGYINDCLISSLSEAKFREKFGLGRGRFKNVKNSALVRFAISFDIVVYK